MLRRYGQDEAGIYLSWLYMPLIISPCSALYSLLQLDKCFLNLPTFALMKDMLQSYAGS